MKFSVLLPTYNRLDLLKYAIQSVLTQDYHDWELIISDNQSEDDVESYVQSLADERIVYSRTDTLLNVTDNWNRALSLASGDYFIMLGDDDALMPQYFSKLVPVIKAENNPDWIYTEAYEYAYPNVLPDYPDGFLLAGRNPMQSWHEKISLDDRQRADILQKSFQMELGINFNMQHSLVRYEFAESLQGDFYQSLFPDYYATLAGIIAASNFVIYPEFMVVIGITPKSHGFFYFNQRLSEAQAILHSDALNKPDAQKIEHLILPPMDWIKVGWMSALYTLCETYQDRLEANNIATDLSTTRQILIKEYVKNYTDNQLSKDLFKSLKNRLTKQELLLTLVPNYLYYLIRNSSLLSPIRGKVRQALVTRQSEHYLKLSTDNATTIMDIVNQYPTSLQDARQLPRLDER